MPLRRIRPCPHDPLEAVGFRRVGAGRVPRDANGYEGDDVGMVAAADTSALPPALAGQPNPYTDPYGWRTWAMGLPLQWKLDTLDPRLRQRVEDILTGLHAAGFTSATVNYGWRHPAIQASLVKDGYSKTPWSLHSAVVYNPDLQAWVATAYAADIHWPDAANDAERARFYRHLQAMAVSMGLVSGANWTGNGPPKAKARWAAYGLGYDPPHVELSISADEKAQVREAILGGILQLAEAEEPVWAIPDTGVLDAYPVSWFRRSESVRQIRQAAVQEVREQVKGNAGWIVGAIGATVVALILTRK